MIDAGSTIGTKTQIWHFSHVFKGAKIGNHCNIGQNVVISDGVSLGDRCKIQNNVSLYSGLKCQADVFLGPSCVLTNISNPRSQVNRKKIYEKTLIQKGATIGANATIVCGVTIGRYSFVAAGSVVTKDIPDYALFVGNPARHVGWMSRHGHRLRQIENEPMVCSESGLRYKILSSGELKCLDLDEKEPLPKSMAIVKKRYRDYQRK
ncbi:N-acetyltransferase [Verrucomicrobia bacterium]|nr:N-acetyltransferase [Verrucomicrobiota bacterium]